MSSKKSGSEKAIPTESNATKTAVIEGKTEDEIGISETLIYNNLLTTEE